MLLKLIYRYYSNLPGIKTQNFLNFCKRYSNQSTNVTQSYFKFNVTQIYPETLLKTNFKGVTKFRNLFAKTAQLKPQRK